MPEPPGPRRPALDLAKPLRLICALAMILIVVLTLAQIFCRFVLDAPLIWSEELARLLIVWLTFIGAAIVSWDGRHLNIDVLFKVLPPRVRQVLRYLNAALAVGLCIALIGPTLRLVKIENFSELGALEIPSGIVRLPVAVGAVLIAIAIVLRLFYRRRGAPPEGTTFEDDAI